MTHRENLTRKAKASAARLRRQLYELGLELPDSTGALIDSDRASVLAIERHLRAVLAGAGT